MVEARTEPVFIYLRSLAVTYITQAKHVRKRTRHSLTEQHIGNAALGQ